jgi:hypothetical protein
MPSSQKIHKIKTRQPYKNMSNVLETQFQWQPLTKSQMRPTKTKQISQILIRWRRYLNWHTIEVSN